MTATDTFRSRWIELDGAVNVRDLGGLPTHGGGAVLANRLIRSDNLQGLTPQDVAVLVEQHEVRAVADLRTGVEVRAEGPGPLVADARVRVEHFSLFPEAGRTTDVAASDDRNRPPSATLPQAGRAPVVLPWQQRRDEARRDGTHPTAASIYLGYLTDRADSVLDALRLIGTCEGATIVHCAAGKDRTGVLTALALGEVGVTREAIVADYAASAERIEAIFARLLASPTYAEDLSGESVDQHRPRAETMERVLDAIDSTHGGVPGWLRAHGWTDADATALRRHLIG